MHGHYFSEHTFVYDIFVYQINLGIIQNRVIVEWELLVISNIQNIA